jgi:hypothetical protein
MPRRDLDGSVNFVAVPATSIRFTTPAHVRTSGGDPVLSSHIHNGPSSGGAPAGLGAPALLGGDSPFRLCVPAGKPVENPTPKHSTPEMPTRKASLTSTLAKALAETFAKTFD